MPSAVKPKAAAWFVYLVRCSDGTLYTGIALDVPARIAAHDAGKGAKYTRGRGPLALLGTQRCPGRGEALRLEALVKALSRPEKLALARAWGKPKRPRASLYPRAVRGKEPPVRP